MQFGRITVIGDGGLLGEILVTELARHGQVSALEEGEALNSSFDPPPDLFVCWGEFEEIGRKRRSLRRLVPTGADPVLIVLSQTDPHIYFTRLRGLHIDRRRLGFDAVLEELEGLLAVGPETAVPVRAGLI